MRILIFLAFVLLFTSCEKYIFTDNSKDPEFVFESFWQELDRNYSFFNYTTLNWDSVYFSNKSKINQHTTDSALFAVFSSIADLLHDGHTNIYTPFGISGSINYFERYPLNQVYNIESYFDQYQSGDRIFEYGKILSSNIGYIKIKTFEGDKIDFNKIDSILTNFSTTDGLIIDVRSNRGGYISNSLAIAGSFADSSRFTCKYRLRNGPGHDNFSGWINVYVSPCKEKITYNNPVVILTNRGCFSAAEWFVMFSDVLPNVTIIGDTTGGGSAIPITRELANGWLLRTSNSQTLLPSGRDFQFEGLYPDIAVWINAEDALKNKDVILEKAVSILDK